MSILKKLQLKVSSENIREIFMKKKYHRCLKIVYYGENRQKKNSVGNSGSAAVPSQFHTKATDVPNFRAVTLL